MAEKIVHVLHTNEKLGAVPEWNAAEVADDELVADKYQGTSADRHDMRMLGRIQVLRVSRRTHLTNTPKLMNLGTAKLQFHSHSGLQRRAHLHMGAAVCVCDLSRLFDGSLRR